MLIAGDGVMIEAIHVQLLVVQTLFYRAGKIVIVRALTRQDARITPALIVLLHHNALVLQEHSYVSRQMELVLNV